MQRFFRYWLPLLLWMLFIFLLSSQEKDASQQLSGRLYSLIHWLTGWDEAMMEQWKLHLLLRKAAHMTEYFVLFLLAYRAVDRSFSWQRAGLLVWGFCVLYAMSDEYHQSFIAGRGSQWSDVLIDAIGAMLGYLLVKWGKKPIARNLEAN